MFGYIPALFLHLPWFLWRKKKSFVKLGFFSFIMWAVHTSDGKANILQPPTQICIPLVFLPASGRLFDGRDGDDFFLVGGYFRSSLFSTFLIPLLQRSPAFLAPGTGFVEDNFSMDGGWGHGFGMIRVHYVYCALYFYYYYIVIIYNEVIIQLTIILTGGGVQAVMWAMGSGYKYRWSFARSPATHPLLCGPVPNRPRTGIGPWPRGWGPLLYCIFLLPYPPTLPFFLWEHRCSHHTYLFLLQAMFSASFSAWKDLKQSLKNC